MNLRDSYPVVVVVSTVQNGPAENPVVRELSSDRYVAATIGAALDAHAPDPSPGAQWNVKFLGRAKDIR